MIIWKAYEERVYCMFEGKTVLVTGATGLIGSHIVDKLMQMDNVRVIALSRSEEKLKKVFEKYLEDSRFRIIVQNVSEKINSDIGPIHYLFHAASPMEGKIITNYPVDVIMPNLIGTINCLEYLKKQKEEGKAGRLVLFSSVTVYGNNTNVDVCVKESDTKIADFLDAGSASYSQSKRMSEVIARSYGKQYGIDVVIARLSTVYGATCVMPDTAFYEFISKALRRENIIVNSSGAPRRDNIYIDDAVNGLLCVAEEGLSNEAYNISSNGDGDNFAAVDEIAAIVVDVSNQSTGKKIGLEYREIVNGERRPGLKMDNTKLKNLGWSVKTNIFEGIKNTLDYYK